MTDRALLELAAKAAGYEVVWLESSYYGPTMARVEIRSGEGEITEPWNPLTDDGDALRLAAKLRIVHERHINQPYVAAWAPGIFTRFEEPETTDPYAATRRAIVRAAAEIGKGMK